MKQVQEAYIVAASRTPIGRSGRGYFRNTRSDDLLVTALRAALANLVAQTQAHIVLVMGRFASQALLNTAEPLGKLRAEAHAWQGAPVVVTYDATYLLRTPADKAKAWQDLRLAMRLMQAV